MKEEEIVENIKKHQKDESWHPYTCANRSDKEHTRKGVRDHGMLDAKIKNGKAIMFCKECGWEQDWIPDMMKGILPTL